MKTNTVCSDVPCDQSVTERPRYYARQLITHDDLTAGQEYFRSKLRMHNRMIHGWGVVCGALVCLVPKAESRNGNGSKANKRDSYEAEQTWQPNKFEPWKVMVKPGYILGPYGDEIYIDCTRTVDLRAGGVTGVTGESCVEASDAWCSEVFEQRDREKLYIAVRYKEIATRPVRVQPTGCGCDETRCEYSRLRDGYEIRVLDYCIDDAAEPPDIETVIGGPNPRCLPCPEEPWVTLAEVTLGADGEISKIDNCSCRRMVISFANLWWRCEAEAGQAAHKIEITRLSANVFLKDLPNQLLEIEGSNLDLVDKITFGDDLQYKIIAAGPAKLEGTVSVPAGTKEGSRPINITAKDANDSYTADKEITVKGSGTPPPKTPEGETPVKRTRKSNK